MANNDDKDIDVKLQTMSNNVNSKSSHSSFKNDYIASQTMSNKVVSSAPLTNDEIQTLTKLTTKIKNISSTYNSVDVKLDQMLQDVINQYRLVVRNHNMNYNQRLETINEINKLIASNNINNNTKIPSLDISTSDILKRATSRATNNGLDLSPNKVPETAILSQSDIKPVKQNKNNTYIPTPKKTNWRDFGSHVKGKANSFMQSDGFQKGFKDITDVGLSALGLGNLNSAFGISSNIGNYINQKTSASNVDDGLQLGNSKSKNISQNIQNNTPVKPVIEDNSKLQSSSDNIDNSIKKSNSLLDEINTSNKHISKISELTFSELKVLSSGKSNSNNNNKKKKDDKDNDDDGIFDSLFDGFGSKGKSSKRKKVKAPKGRGGKLGRVGRVLGKGAGAIGRVGSIAANAVGLGSAIGIASDVGSTVLNGAGKAVSGVGNIASKALGGIGSVAGVGKIASIAGKAGKFIPGIGTALTLGSAGLSAYQGYDEKQAQQLFGSKSTSAKIGSSIASVGNDLSFGLISKESIAGVEKSIGSGVTSAFNWLIGKKDKEDLKAKVTTDKKTDNANTNGELTQLIFGMKPQELQSMFSMFSSSVSSFITGLPSILQGLTPGKIADAASSVIPGMGAARGLADAASQSGVAGAIGGAFGFGNGGAGDIITGKGNKFGGDNDGSLGNTGKGKKLSQVTDERTQILYNEAKKSGMSDKELAVFMGQHDQETGNFKFMRELASGEKYEGRKDLGNTQKGDGVRYKGRGYNQLTGRANYAKYGKMVGVDLVNHPELAEDPKISAQISMAYWQDRRAATMKKYGKLDAQSATRMINGGTNGLDQRLVATAKWQNAMSSGDNKFEKAYETGNDWSGNAKSVDNSPTGKADNTKQVSPVINKPDTQTKSVSGNIEPDLIKPTKNEIVNPLNQSPSNMSYADMAGISIAGNTPMNNTNNTQPQSSIVVPPDNDNRDYIDDPALLMVQRFIIGNN